jgi:DUF2075 family protein
LISLLAKAISMTDFKLEHLSFQTDHINLWRQADPTFDDWPVVYIINNDTEIYVGETVNAATRMLQHRATPGRQHLKQVRIILNDKFNKSACLDLESHLIRYFAADEKYKVLNGNWGISESNYFQREEYRRDFESLFEQLHKDGLLTRPVPELINSNLFKYSPFKALNSDQAIALSGILEALLSDLEKQDNTELVVQGDPGTGKTIVAIYLVKLLRDIAGNLSDEIVGQDSIFSEYFTEKNKQHLNDFRIGLVIPQQSLRKTIQKVFAKTPGLDKEMIISPFDVGRDLNGWDLLIVDEAHRLGIRSSQSSGIQNQQLPEINRRLFGEDRNDITQLDWVRRQSKHQILLIDSAQSIRPADLPKEVIEGLAEAARGRQQLFRLTSQMRINGGRDYIEFINKLMSESPEQSPGFGNYDLRFFDSFVEMCNEIKLRNNEHTLARLLAGFAWKWNSKRNKTAHDIEIEGVKLFWNRTATDWVNSPTSHQEVGSIHTIQGYDLNYAGVIIGPDLGFDPVAQRITFHRESYFDTKGKENNKKLGIEFSDEDIRQYVVNIYRVLLTRGIKGTYIYVYDDALREHLKQFF